MRNLENTLQTKHLPVKAITFFLAVLALTILLSAREAAAANFTVTSLADNESDGCGANLCTLREAVDDANALAGADTITFTAGASSGTITLNGAQLLITDALTISGPGARNLAVSGDDRSRVFLIASPLFSSDFTVNVSGLTITGGNATPLLIGSTLIGDGGGILNGALLDVSGGTSTLNLTDSVVSNNRTTTLGGGIATRIGAVTNINRSLITDNRSNPLTVIDDGTVGGGGISNAVLSTTTIVNSTITGNNSLAIGGGILNVAGTVNLTNDTVSHNNSTLAGGGVVSLLGVVPPVLGITNLRNTIIAKNNDLLAINIVGRDVAGVLGSFNSLGNNLIGSNFGAEANFGASVFAGSTPLTNAKVDIVGGIAAGNQIVDPLLGNLQNNGGLTDTRAISAVSPALNRGNNCVFNNTCAPNPAATNPPFILTTDQRGTGFSRLGGPVVDIGAFEAPALQAPTGGSVAVSGRVVQGRGGAAGAVVKLTDAGGRTRNTATDASGYYRFNDVAVGETYILSATTAKRFEFAPLVVFIAEQTSELNFTSK